MGISLSQRAAWLSQEVQVQAFPTHYPGLEALTVRLPPGANHRKWGHGKTGIKGHIPSLPQAGFWGRNEPSTSSYFLFLSLPVSPSQERGFWPLPSIAWQQNLPPQAEQRSTDVVRMRGLKRGGAMAVCRHRPPAAVPMVLTITWTQDFSHLSNVLHVKGLKKGDR